MYKLVNWHNEGLSEYYGDNNNGLIYGLYYYDDPDDFPIEIEWFDSEENRAAVLAKLKAA